MILKEMLRVSGRIVRSGIRLILGWDLELQPQTKHGSGLWGLDWVRAFDISGVPMYMLGIAWAWRSSLVNDR